MKSSHALKMQLAPWALLLVAASWGMAFVVMKDPIEKQGVNSFLFTRFLVAVLVMWAIRPGVIRKIDRQTARKGFLAGLFLGAGYVLQTLGLALAGAAITGFITGLYVVATPLITALIFKVKISRFTWQCVALATIGLALLSLKGWSAGLGEFLVFLCAIAFAAHIVALSRWSKGLDAYALTIVQLATCALLTGGLSFVQGFFGAGYKAPVNLSGWLVVAYTAVISTAVAFVVQTWSQAHMSATKVAVILTMEVVFAAIFAVLFGGESLTLQALFGGLLVLTAMFLIVLREGKDGN
jgi:drug/metabolite transporter (DMT)-like permease